MNDGTDLKEVFRRLSEALPAEASAAAEERVLAAFRANRRCRPPRWAYWATAAACLAAFAVGFWGADSSKTLPPFRVATVTDDSFHTAMTGFIALPYAQSGVPVEQAVIVRMKLRPSELGALGVPLGAANAGGHISAELLVGQDGVARAVRVLQ
jgi:hypothetical protein